MGGTEKDNFLSFLCHRSLTVESRPTDSFRTPTGAILARLEVSPFLENRLTFNRGQFRGAGQQLSLPNSPQQAYTLLSLTAPRSGPLLNLHKRLTNAGSSKSCWMKLQWQVTSSHVARRGLMLRQVEFTLGSAPIAVASTVQMGNHGVGTRQKN
jgi:hypothetical protein